MKMKAVREINQVKSCFLFLLHLQSLSRTLYPFSFLWYLLSLALYGSQLLCFKKYE